jgi:2-polyprenyl-3-methyl-5-hydroxy-6-metoxy-1,4-benzoquinol methylase
MIREASTYRYQRNFSRLLEGMYDAHGRAQKGAKVAAVLTDYFRRRALDPTSLHVLDVGCSTGILTAQYARHFGRVVGTDIDTDAVRYAAAQHAGDAAHFLIADSMKLPFRDASFDVVTCTHIYEHVPDAKRLIAEIHRVLRPGGCCFFSAGNRLVWTEPHYRLPLLSVVPKRLAHLYMRATGKGDHYYEQHLWYWGLRKLVSRFDVIDYTLEIVRRPEAFAATDLLRSGSLKQRLALAVLRVAYWACPTYIWVLYKPTPR